MREHVSGDGDGGVVVARVLDLHLALPPLLRVLQCNVEGKVCRCPRLCNLESAVVRGTTQETRPDIIIWTTYNDCFISDLNL